MQPKPNLARALLGRPRRKKSQEEDERVSRETKNRKTRELSQSNSEEDSEERDSEKVLPFKRALQTKRIEDHIFSHM